MMMSRPSRPTSAAGSSANALSASASSTSGIVALLHQLAHERRHALTAPEARPHDDDVGVEPQHGLRGGEVHGARRGLLERLGHVLRRRSRRRSAGTTAGEATVTSPAPERSAPCAASAAAPGLPHRAGDDDHAAEVALVRVGGARRNQRAQLLARQQLDPRPVELIDHAGGMPMSAITTSPDICSAGGSTSGSFGAPSVTVTVASTQSPISSRVSADSPDGRSIDTIGSAAGVEVGDHRLVAGP